MISIPRSLILYQAIQPLQHHLNIPWPFRPLSRCSSHCSLPLKRCKQWSSKSILSLAESIRSEVNGYEVLPNLWRWDPRSSSLMIARRNRMGQLSWWLVLLRMEQLQKWQLKSHTSRVFEVERLEPPNPLPRYMFRFTATLPRTKWLQCFWCFSKTKEDKTAIFDHHLLMEFLQHWLWDTSILSNVTSHKSGRCQGLASLPLHGAGANSWVALLVPIGSDWDIHFGVLKSTGFSFSGSLKGGTLW